MTWPAYRRDDLRSLFVQARGALRKELTACLRTGRTQRRSHGSEHSGRPAPRHGPDQRPRRAADRACRGKGDLMVGKGGRSAEHSSRSSRWYSCTCPAAGCEHVRRALTHQKLPTELGRSPGTRGKSGRMRSSPSTPRRSPYFCDVPGSVAAMLLRHFPRRPQHLHPRRWRSPASSIIDLANVGLDESQKCLADLLRRPIELPCV